MKGTDDVRKPNNKEVVEALAIAGVVVGCVVSTGGLALPPILTTAVTSIFGVKAGTVAMNYGAEVLKAFAGISGDIVADKITDSFNESSFSQEDIDTLAKFLNENSFITNALDNSEIMSEVRQMLAEEKAVLGIMADIFDGRFEDVMGELWSISSQIEDLHEVTEDGFLETGRRFDEVLGRFDSIFKPKKGLNEAIAEIEPAIDGEILIVIAKFNQQSMGKIEPHNEWYDLLIDLIFENGLDGFVRIENLNVSLKNRTQAKIAQNYLNAFMVIWGSSNVIGSNASFKTRFEIDPSFFTKVLSDKDDDSKDIVSASSPFKISQVIAQGSLDSLSEIVLVGPVFGSESYAEYAYYFLLGQIFLFDRQARLAVKFLKSAEKTLEWIVGKHHELENKSKTQLLLDFGMANLYMYLVSASILVSDGRLIEHYLVKLMDLDKQFAESSNLISLTEIAFDEVIIRKILAMSLNESEDYHGALRQIELAQDSLEKYLSSFDEVIAPKGFLGQIGTIINIDPRKMQGQTRNTLFVSGTHPDETKADLMAWWCFLKYKTGEYDGLFYYEVFKVILQLCKVRDFEAVADFQLFFADVLKVNSLDDKLYIDKTIAWSKIYLRENPKDEAVIANLGLYPLKNGSLKLAVEIYSLVIYHMNKVYPQSVSDSEMAGYYYNRGTAFYLQNRKVEAEADYIKALAIDSSFENNITRIRESFNK